MSLINLMGEGHFIKLDWDRVSYSLLYFGGRQMTSVYGSNEGFKFDAIAVNDLKITENKKKKDYEVALDNDNWVIEVNASARQIF